MRHEFLTCLAMVRQPSRQTPTGRNFSSAADWNGQHWAQPVTAHQEERREAGSSLMLYLDEALDKFARETNYRPKLHSSGTSGSYFLAPRLNLTIWIFFKHRGGLKRWRPAKNGLMNCQINAVIYTRDASASISSKSRGFSAWEK